MSDRRDIPGYSGRYTISSNGLILNRKGFVVFPHKDRDGYKQVRLYADDGRKSDRVHRLVCRVFHGAPGEGQEARHLDGDKENNSAENLAWGSKAENAADSIRHGVFRGRSAPAGERHHGAKLTNAQVADIREALTGGEAQRSIARRFGISQTQVCHIGQRKAWTESNRPRKVA